MNESLLFETIASAIADTPISKNSISAEELEALYKIAKKHDLAHIVGYVLDKKGLLDASPVSEKFKKQVYLAIYRYQQLNHELCSICDLLDEEKIDHIPLKGSVIRDIYPEPWMRTSCDIDILIKEEDLDKAISVLVNKLNYKAEDQKAFHDISLFAENGVHLELHFSLKENMKNIDPLLDRVWNYTSLTDEKKHKYSLTPEFFIFHHIAHMSYHFVHGGCGVKPFIDLYLIRKNWSFDNTALQSLFAECKMERFYESVSEMSNVWFAKAEHTDTTRQIEEYILNGGVYGTFENKVTVQRQIKGGKLGYLMYKVFIPYALLKSQYPVLEKHPYLMPVMHVRRWIRVIFKKKTAKEINYINNVNRKEADKTKDLLQNIGLM